MRVWFTIGVFLMAAGPLPGGLTSDNLVQITAGATHLSIAGRLNDGKRPVVYRSSSPKEIAQFVSCFDFVDVEPGRLSQRLCTCIPDYEIEITLANGSQLTIEVKHDFSILLPVPSVLPDYPGNLHQTPNGVRKTREWIEGKETANQALQTTPMTRSEI